MELGKADVGDPQDEGFHTQLAVQVGRALGARKRQEGPALFCGWDGSEETRIPRPPPPSPRELDIPGDFQAAVKGLHKRNQNSESRWMGLRESPRSCHMAHLPLPEIRV